MSTPSIKVGQGNWGIKAGNLLAYANTDKKFVARDFTVGRLLDTATRVNASGNIQIVNANVPRIDYFGGQASLLVEPSATNSMFYSQFINSWPTKTGLTITDNNAISPDGTQNASYIQQTTGGAIVSLISPVVTVASAQPQSVSFYAKAGQVTSVTLQFGTPALWVGSTRVRFTIDLLTGGISIISGTGTASSVAVGNGWYKYSVVTAATVASGTTSIQTVTNTVFSPNSGDGFYLWGVQWEQNTSTPTSYIPTTTGSVTRNADVISLTGVAGLIGQTEGTLYAEVDVRNTISRVASILQLRQDGNNQITLGITTAFGGTNTIAARAQQAGSFVVGFFQPNNAAGIYKIAFAYKSTDCKLYINGTDSGVTISLNNAFTAFSFNEIQLGMSNSANQFNDRIRAVSIYQTRLPNTTTDGSPSLQSITTL
jgi:hypothetical protein